MVCDQHRLRQRLREVKANLQNQKRGGADRIDAIVRDIATSAEQRADRLRHLPKPTFPDDLPIAARRHEIARAISDNQVVIVCGETGSGKTTQLPKICLELGRGVGGMIGHTQPRRISARTVAMRIASELASPIGHAVGYKVRFTDRTHRDTYIKIMTDGILLAETQKDRSLTQYDTLIIDEAHERGLNIDFLLGYIKQLLPKRPDLKVIVTSATIDPKRFSDHFSGAPIIEVSGRTYPVEVRYRPVQADEPDEDDPTVLEAIVQAVDEVSGDTAQWNSVAAQGNPTARDILVFLSGEREIRETAEALRKHHPPHTQILPLYARLSVEEQNRVFQPHDGLRIVLATNVAETSLTVPGIRYVIDPGFARISRYSAGARVQRLPIERVSQASANQRAGRCGRVAPGVCIRLYSEEDFESREGFTDPEILRANLAAVILQMKALGLGEIEHFPFLDPPRAGMIREGYQTLLELGAVDDHGQMTSLGKELSRLPVDPRLGRMILAARHEQCLKEVLIIASALATQDPRLRPMDAALSADAAHVQFLDESSDFLSYLKLWEFYHAALRDLSTSKLRKLCHSTFLSYVRLREWHDVHQQLHALVTESGMKLNDSPGSSQAIHRALLTGLLNNIGTRGEGHDYKGPRDRTFHIFPGSSLFKKPPKWMMAGELVETTRLYARTVARIHPEWVEKVGKHLIKRTHSDPHWNEQSAHVEAFERVSLHGLVIVPKRRIAYGPINPVQAREIFITQALVEGALTPPFDQAPFFIHNRQLMAQIHTLEAKQRRRGVIIRDDAIFEFFDRRIPPASACVYDGPSFEQWRKKAEREQPNLLFLSTDELFGTGTDLVGDTVELYPDFVSLDGVRVPLTYIFDPGATDDGVTATIPIDAIDQISQRAVDWMIPGYLHEKVEELVRTLPKAIRRNFVPVPDHAAHAVQVMHFGQGDLLEQLGRELHRTVGEPIPRDGWHPERLPDHLRMRLRIVDTDGKTIAEGRDLIDLRRRAKLVTGQQESSQHLAVSCSPNADVTTFARHDNNRGTASIPSDRSDAPEPSYTAWKFGDLAQHIDIKRGDYALRAFPAIVDAGHSVVLRQLHSLQKAHAAHRGGLRRLFLLQVQEELEAHVQYLPNMDELSLLYSPLGTGERLQDELMLLIVDRVFLGDGEDALVYTESDFGRRLRSGWDRLWPVVDEMSGLVERILSAWQSLTLQLDEAENPVWMESIADMRAQLHGLIASGFLTRTPFAWLHEYPRYLAAVSARFRKLSTGNVTRDRQAMHEMATYFVPYADLAQRDPDQVSANPLLQRFRWMIEEYRVSLFAQELGTLMSVSGKRLDAAWQEIRSDRTGNSAG